MKKQKILTQKQIVVRSVISGIIFAVLGFIFDYFQYRMLNAASIIINIIEGITFAIFMIVFMNGYYTRKSKK